MVHRGTRSKAAQERRAERSILYRKEESYQFGGVELWARSEVNSLSHGYSRTDRRSNERNAEANCRTGKPIGGRTPPKRKPRQSSTCVGQVDDTTSTTASSEIGGYKGELDARQTSAVARKRVWRKAFPVWQRKMQNYIISVFPDLREPLEWAAVLMQVTEGEANDIVCNSGGMGLEAWRKLTRRWNPLTGSRLRNLLRHVISPGRASLTELPGALERWEEQVSKYRNSKNQQGQSRDILEDILMAVLESLVPTDLEVHLQMNGSRFETYDAMRAEVLAFIESRTGSRMTETKVHKHDKIRDDSMDVDSVVKGKGKNKFSGSCYICGRVGHKFTECWSRDRVSNKGSGKTQNANVSSLGKGKSIGKGCSKGQRQGQRQVEV